MQTANPGQFCTLGAVPRLYMYNTYLIMYLIRYTYGKIQRSYAEYLLHGLRLAPADVLLGTTMAH
eukprot:COSAG02_NODE_1394_length_12906_cov_3.129304_6_plen_65_part_00